ncbi:hypothetical protein K3H42_09790 [Aeromonas veronii]|uniref:hypothetical protein n=1 Tax=Aeromonas veronii TaxID=654 RepID=UPI001F184FD4|nr:hypothetical protein [Aeromonas veronii]MCF5895397.1 hypothetical protein [Aeromonas veronii]
MDNINNFIHLICGDNFNEENDIDKVLKHLSTSLEKILIEIRELPSLNDDKIGLYGPYLGRALLELSITALLGRLDPFKILLMKGVQEQNDYDLGKPHSSAIRWQGDVLDKAVPNLWDEKALKEPTRAILGAYQIELAMINSAKKIVDTGSEESIGEWYTEISNTDSTGLVKKIQSKIATLYSSLSKGIHHELLIPYESILDRDTVINLVNDSIFVISTLGLLVSQIPHAYKYEDFDSCAVFYKSSKELELI